MDVENFVLKDLRREPSLIARTQKFNFLFMGVIPFSFRYGFYILILLEES